MVHGHNCGLWSYTNLSNDLRKNYGLRGNVLVGRNE